MPKIMNVITNEKLDKYFLITKKAIDKAKTVINSEEKEKAEDFLDMATRYYDDAQFFRKKGNIVNAFAAVNYSHGWLDAGARIGLFKVKDSHLFTVD